eukprot:2175760-Amphidinium_carterae.1
MPERFSKLAAPQVTGRRAVAAVMRIQLAMPGEALKACPHVGQLLPRCQRMLAHSFRLETCECAPVAWSGMLELAFGDSVCIL